MRLLEGAAAASGVQIRKLTAQNVVSRDYHFDMPFVIQVDGPYYDIVDFFARLSRLSRIINVGDLKFDTLGGDQVAVSRASDHHSDRHVHDHDVLYHQRVRRAAPRAEEASGRPAPSELKGKNRADDAISREKHAQG